MHDGADSGTARPCEGSLREPIPVGRREDLSRSRGAAARQRYDRLRRRAETGTTGEIRRRVRELEVMNHALIMASLSLTLLVPAVVTLAALLPVGSDHGLAADATRRLGLSAEAARDVRQLFPSRETVAGSTTALSAVVTMFFAVGWPAELQRGYQAIWGLPSRGIREFWRSVVWLVSFFVLLATVVSVGALVSGIAGAILTGLVGLPVSFAWAWWTQHLLLGGRVPWRALFPGAVTTSLCLLGFSIGMRIYLPIAITDNYDKYGPIGVLFALLSWIIGFSAVMLGGPLVGHTIHLRRQQPNEPTAADSTTEPAPDAAESGSQDAEVASPPDGLVPP